MEQSTDLTRQLRVEQDTRELSLARVEKSVDQLSKDIEGQLQNLKNKIQAVRTDAVGVADQHQEQSHQQISEQGYANVQLSQRIDRIAKDLEEKCSQDKHSHVQMFEIVEKMDSLSQQIEANKA